MNDIETLVHVEVDARLNEMSGLKPSDDEYKATADVTLKLIDKATRMRELDIQEEANRLKREEIEEDKKRRKSETFNDYVKFGLKLLAGAGMAFALTNYERRDSLTSTATKIAWKDAIRWW